MDARTDVIAALKADPATCTLRRSLDTYYGDPARDASMDAFYARFVVPGDLAFDLGAHVGDHIACFRRLGARVVAVEPQPLCVRALRALYADDDQVRLVEAACGAEPGRITLAVNSANPTLSTASPHFRHAAGRADGWRHEVWDDRAEVPLVTLDALIDTYGVPGFVKIDVEGFEDAVLAGLSRPLSALSFEFTTIARPVAHRCLDRLTALGLDGFNLALGDSRRLVFPDWVPAARVADHLRALPPSANSGDVYARYAGAGS
ncbi:FkbM family methyltransferase [Micromonospora sp. PLK6-60]|uniref:FkbM family methyltransferase n=1 Tax=Micromonospora sp. PLK6-60 TaxID=2873383 RepID=UPI001CA657C5|nr:FkbM family methyltransferase [Micromonospora sp. PLK6-60]MBY8870458.1 FkbM family methyltransferase [Micromonospora sp. PLK6-60]